MSVPPISPALEHLGRRPFSFYPPILNIEHNEWLFRQANWSEILVVNTKTGLELWVPRQYMGEISSIDEPVMIVGLLKELEYKAGRVWPHERRVLEMPVLSGESLRTPGPEPPARPAGAGGRPTGSSTESRIGRLIGTAVVGGLLICFLVVAVYQIGPPRSKVVFTAKDEAFLELSRRDDYYAVVRKLGRPGEDRWRSETGELQYRLLWYPDRAYSVVLMGPDRNNAHYIGAVDRNWRVLHYVELANGGNTGSLLRGLPKF
jgi:hypothetical protein